MVGSSKILTVSYGTYSVTAEGFEDPLGVVKDTTQFIRGVVTEDPLFGAEPPQIGSDMIEDYIQTRFAPDPQARLSFGPPAASSGALAAALSAGPARARTTPSLPDDDTIEAAAGAAVAEADLDAATGAAPLGDPAETLPTEPAAGAAQAPLEETGDTPPAPKPAARSPEASSERAAADGAEKADHPEPDDQEGMDDGPGEADTAGHAALPQSAPRAADPTSVAAKLARIRSVVAGGTAGPAAASADPEPEPADPEPEPADSLWSGSPLPADSVAAFLDTLDDETARSDDPATAVENPLHALAAEPADRDDTLSALIGEQDDTAEGDAAESLFAGIDAPGDDGAAPAEAGAENDWRDILHDTDESDGARAATPNAQEAQPASVPAGPDASDAPTHRPLRARVVKVKRAVFDRDVSDGRLEEVTHQADYPSAAEDREADTLRDSSLSPEEEDELAHELAAVKAELAGGFEAWGAAEDAIAPEGAPPASERGGTGGTLPVEKEGAAPTDDDADLWDDETDEPAPAASASLRPDDPAESDAGDSMEGARKAVRMASAGRAMLTEQEVAEDHTDRLLDQTNEEMDEPEGNRRRSAIAHLRAAVAATRADRLLGRRPDAEEQTEPYREDLATVVRPRRPQSGGIRSERPVEAERPAPLKLVAEQRVADDQAATPVRPRRVRSADIAPRQAPQGTATAKAQAIDAPAGDRDGEGFAAYAARVGARDLPDLLEAAAAYMSFVEGRDQFSRPQLMTTVRQAEMRESSREDRLRSFGQLLREGKIEKTSGGRFTASDRISFKPRKAG